MRIKPKRQRGASLVEIIVTVGVLAVGLYSLGFGLQAARSGSNVALRAMKAETIATNIVEMLQVDSDAIASTLTSQNPLRIPANGFLTYGDNKNFRWTAEIARMEGQPAARVKVSIVTATTDKPLAVANGILSLSMGGKQ